MSKTLPEYADWLADRDLIWPTAPEAKPVKAAPYTKPLPGIRAVTWDVYGTLLRLPDGCLDFDPEPEIRLQVALEKTIREFNMWHSMTRKPGAPWEYMIRQYRDFLADQKIAGGVRKGDNGHISLPAIWKAITERLQQKDYEYDILFYGSLEQFCEKVAFFFHSALQATAGATNALRAVRAVSAQGCEQGLLADAQPFTLLQLLRGLQSQGTLPPLHTLFQPELLVLSFEQGVRKPSPTLFEQAAGRFRQRGIAPDEVLYVGSRMTDDLAVARQYGFRTALFAGDGNSVEAPREMLTDPATKPERLLTDLAQIESVLAR